MWFLFTPFILLFTISSIKSSEDAIFSIEEIYNELSSFSHTSENLHLESELLNGKVTSMELVEKLLGRKIDETALNEYSKMDISNGIKEQNELMDLFEKAKKSGTSDQVKKDIENGFDEMEGVKDYKPNTKEVQNLSEKVSKEMKKIEDIAKLDFQKIDIGSSITKAKRGFEEALSAIEELFKLAPPNQPIPAEVSKSLNMGRLIGHTCAAFEDIHLQTEVLYYELRGHRHQEPLPYPNSVNLLLESSKTLKGYLENIHKLKSQTTSLSAMEVEMSLVEQLRDSQTVKELLLFMKKLMMDFDSLKGFNISENVLNKYQKIGTTSKFIQKIQEFTSVMKIIESTIPQLMENSKSLENHLENLKIPSGSLSETFKGLKTCLESSDFSTELPKTADQIINFLKERLEKIKPINSRADYLWEKIYDMMQEAKRFDYVCSEVKDFEVENFLKKFIWPFDPNDLKKLIIYFQKKRWRPEKPDEETSMVESLAYEIKELAEEIHKIGVNDISKLAKDMMLEMKKMPHFLKCYFDLKVAPSAIKSLMDLPKTVWNFNPIQLETTAEVIESLKEANKMMNELNNWKFDSNPSIDTFPLNSEDVTGMSDGFESLKSIQNIQNDWIQMTNLDDSQIEELNVRNEWDEVKTSLEILMDHLSHMQTHSELSDFQSLISTFQVSSDLQIDSIIDFIKLKYQGNDQNGILNILEDVKNLQKDFPSYSAKLQKMNESIEKLKKWMEKPENEELIFDCFENPSCGKLLSLPETSPE